MVGYRYSVIFRGNLLVKRSRDPECDAARALLAHGITGKLTMLDGKTGKPRYIIDIEKAAKLTIREDRRRGPCFVKFQPFDRTASQRVEGRSQTAETGSSGTGTRGRRA
jgi:hypothetical protein